MRSYAGENTLAEFSRIVKGAIAAAGGTGDTTYLVKAPVGTIVIWSGTADNIPTGWALCDGQDGRPDLRDKFVLGAGTAHAVGDTGGEETHTLTEEEMPEHNHKYSLFYRDGFTVIPDDGGNYVYKNTERLSSSKTGGSQPHNNMPPYYALCYIIKVTADETDGPTYTAGDGIDITQTEAGPKIGVTTPVRSIVTQAEFNALPEAERNKGLYVISDGDEGGGGGGGSEEVYSTEETRIGTWIDGKPLYRRVVETQVNGSVEQWIKIAEIADIDQMIFAFGKVNANDNSGQVSVPGQLSNIKLIAPNKLSFSASSSYQVNTTICIIILYTKTTDTGGTT